GAPALLFGPYAGFTTKFLKNGSWLDMFKSINGGNLRPMLNAGLHNMDLTRYLIAEVFQSHEERIESLRQFYPQARADDWSLATAGQRVQIIKQVGRHGGKLEFGTEIVAAQDGTLAALLGASPGASTSVPAMIEVIERCLKNRLGSGWQEKMQAMIPSYGKSLVNDAELLGAVRHKTLQVLGLDRR
ncbi:MAG TPA: malate:quinone oxidoreductase, partial [Methylophilaceae bacterium]|nr:malate:quinone oxidoreductase [Methylophilaceae bacterium]